MQKLKYLAQKILKKPLITHKELKPKKWEIEELRTYLPTVWYKLLTTFIVDGQVPLPLSRFHIRKLWNNWIKWSKMKYLWKWVEYPEKRIYKIIKL